MRQRTFQDKLDRMIGFIRVADYTDEIKNTLFRVLIRRQYILTEKILLICPEDVIIEDEESVEEVPRFHISHGELDGKKLTGNKICDYVKNGYSVFIYDLKTCLDQKILTKKDYDKFVNYTTNYFYEKQKKYFISSIKLDFNDFTRYVIDLTGLETDKDFNLSEKEKEVANWSKKDNVILRDIFHYLCFYEDKPEDCQEFQQAIEDFDYNLACGYERFCKRRRIIICFLLIVLIAFVALKITGTI